MTRQLLLLAGFALALACASLNPSSEVVRLDPTEHRARHPSDVAILDAFPADRAYTSLARIQVADGGWEESRTKMIERLRQQAGPLGAEAIVVEEVTTRRRAVMTCVGGGGFFERVLAGTAIAYEPPPESGG